MFFLLYQILKLCRPSWWTGLVILRISDF